MIAGLVAHGVGYRAGGRMLLRAVDLAVRPGRVVAVLGPNGAGKSTLMQLLAGTLRPDTGLIALDGQPLPRLPADERALRRAVLPQAPRTGPAFTAGELVALGRHPHRRRPGRAGDRAIVAETMAATATTAFAGTDCLLLSGGERHRVHLARVLAQIWEPLPEGRTRTLLLDEPTASLDLFHQHALMRRARTMVQAGVGILVVLHDIDLAAAYADDVLVLHDGAVAGYGTPEQVLTCARIASVWKVRCTVLHGSASRPRILIEP